VPFGNLAKLCSLAILQNCALWQSCKIVLFGNLAFSAKIGRIALFDNCTGAKEQYRTFLNRAGRDHEKKFKESRNVYEPNEFV
jgi:hypothetical protein